MILNKSELVPWRSDNVLLWEIHWFNCRLKSLYDHNFWMWNLPSRRAKWGNEGLKCKTTGDSYPGCARLRTPWVTRQHACVFCVLMLQRHVNNWNWGTGSSGLCVYDNKTSVQHRRMWKSKRKITFLKMKSFQRWADHKPDEYPHLGWILFTLNSSVKVS